MSIKVWDGSQWVEAAGGVDALAQLTDVDVTGAQIGDVLTYDGYEWVDQPVPNDLPTGGTTGQVLSKASNTNYDTQWATLPEEARGDQPRIEPTSGLRYVPRHVGSTFALATTGMSVQGFTLTRSATVDEIRIRVTTGVTGNATIALYGSTSSAAPSTLIWSGTVVVTTIGFKAASLNESLTPGTYWVGAMASDATATVYGEGAGTSSPNGGFPRASGQWDNLARYGAYRFVATVAGTPDASPTWTFGIGSGPGVATYDIRFA